jgi:hypothetical protein
VRLLRRKREPERMVDRAGDWLESAVDRLPDRTMRNAGLLAGALAVLTAGSAGISSLRRRMDKANVDARA